MNILNFIAGVKQGKKICMKKKKKKSPNNMVVRAATNKCREILIELP